MALYIHIDWLFYFDYLRLQEHYVKSPWKINSKTIWRFILD